MKRDIQPTASMKSDPAAMAMLELIAQGERDIKAGRVIEQEHMFVSLRSNMSPKQNSRTKTT